MTEAHDAPAWLVAVAAAAKSLQSCLTLCDLRDGSPPGSPIPGILQARTLEWVAICFSNAWKWKVKVKPLSHVWLLVTPWTVAYQAPPSASAKSPLSSGFLPRSLPPQDPQVHYCTYQVFMRLSSSLKANCIRGLYSISSFQKAIINHMIFFSVFIIQTIFACPLSQWLPTLTGVLLF